MPRNRLPNAAPKPKRSPLKKPLFSSIPQLSYAEKCRAAATLRAKTKPPKRRKKRSKSETARIYGPEDFRKWLHQQPCVVCGYQGPEVEAAHTRNGGIGYKASWRHQAPMCGPRLARTYSEGKPGTLIEGCHRKLHRVGRHSFECITNVDLDSAAAGVLSSWMLLTGQPIEGTE